MKKSTTIGLIATLMFALINLTGICQEEPELQQGLQWTNAACSLKSFTVKQIDQKNYLSWKVLSTLPDYYFVIEKSIDGRLFFTVSIKKGGISPANQALQFSFIDDTDNSSKTIYRLSAYELHLPDEGTQFVNLNEKDIFNESQNAITVVTNNYNELSAF